MTMKGRDWLRMFNSSYASSSSSYVPMLLTSVKCFSLTLEAAEKLREVLTCFISFLTCVQQRNKQKKVGDHLQGGHPESFLQDRVVRHLVVLRGSLLLLTVPVDVEVLVDVRHVERLDHMSDLVQPAGFLEVVAHLHLEDEDGNAVEQDEPDEDEEPLLSCHQRVVGDVRFAVHQVHNLSAPEGSGALNVF